MKYSLFLSCVFYLYCNTASAQIQLKEQKENKSLLENIHKTGARIFEDTAIYPGGQIFYVRTSERKARALKIYFPDGTLFIQGASLGMRKNKLFSRSGSWKIYYPNGNLKESLTYKNGRRYGNYYHYDTSGSIIKHKLYKQRLSLGLALYGFYDNAIVQHEPGLTKSVSVGQSFGISTAFMAMYNINKRLDLRAQVLMAAQRHNIYYDFKTGTDETARFEYRLVKFPIHLVVRPFEDERVHIIAGSTIGLSSGNEDNFRKYNFDIKGSQMSLDAGIGYLFNIKTVRLLPEIRYSHGLTNFLGTLDSRYVKGLQSLYSNQFTVVVSLY